jgi:DNA-directed RNA polymerase subunit RPC12/RpoP
MKPPTDLSDWLASTWAESIRDRPAQNVWEFARDFIAFTAKMGNREGPYDPDLTPYTKLFQEAVTSDFRDVPDDDWWIRDLLLRGQRVDEAFFVKSSQSGVTQGALNACVYIPLFAPGRLLYSLDSREKAKRVATQRLIPLLRQHCGRVIADDADLNATLIELANMLMEFGGSFSSGLFSEKPLRYGFLDDVEYMVAEGGVAGMLDGVHVIDHMRSRFTTADESFLGVFSKPNLESSEFITNARGGSQHRRHVACPHCGARQIWEPEGLYYDHPGCKDLLGRYDFDAVEALTTYQCAHCRKHFDEARHKYQCNKEAIWLPKSKEQRRADDDPPLVPRRMSMQISDLYSPFPKVKWGILARMKIEAENNPAKLKHLVTNHWGRPWREKAINLKADQVRACIAGALDKKTGKHYPDDLDGEGRLKVPAYHRGECPFRPVLVSATSDVQGDKFKFTVCGWKIDGTCALIEYGACLSSGELYEKMIDLRDHEGNPIIWIGDPDHPLVASNGLIDSGHDTYDIYNFCIRTNWLWYPSKGVGGLDTGGKLVEGKDDFYEGTPILRYHYHDSAIKVHFYGGKIQKAHDPRWKNSRLYFPSDLDDDFITELISESLVPKATSSNIKRMVWEHDKKIGPNDWGDAMKMQFVIWQIRGPQLQAEAQLAAIAAGKASPPREYVMSPDPPLVTPKPAAPAPKRTLAEVLAALRI